ncbi:hypothetical protein BLA29_012817, partial [Euroglyphus maynei]
KHPTHLKQAIITNVYLTTTAPLATVAGALPLTSMENNEDTSGKSVATGTALLPVYYVKRVTPLKKLSSSVSQKRTKKLKKSRIISDGQVSVVLKTHDTFYSASGDVQEPQTISQDELADGSKKSEKKLLKLHDENEDENDEEEDEYDGEGEDKLIDNMELKDNQSNITE